MTTGDDLNLLLKDPKLGTLSPLPRSLSVGLVPVAAFGFVSFFAALSLFLFLVYRMILWKRRSRSTNQFVFLIANLLFADVQQSIAFLLNAKWLIKNAIEVGTVSCWAQGWFISTGDMGSGAWSFAIGLHTFATVVFGHRLSNRVFLLLCVLIWCFIFGLAIGGIHPNIYVRANAWCWVSPKHSYVRLWQHYFWIYFFEFGTVFVYVTMIVIVRIRVQGNFYPSTDQAQRATEAAKLMLAYPFIYVVCTLPLATLRMISYRNPTAVIPLEWFCFAGAMITSNGWLDVLLYTLTRRIMIFSDEPPTDNGIESFGTLWSSKPIFGTETVCEHVPDSHVEGKTRRFNGSLSDNSSATELNYMAADVARAHDARNPKASSVNITEKTTVEVRSELLSVNEAREVRKINKMGDSSVPGLGKSRIRVSMSQDGDGEGSTRRLWQGTNTSVTDDIGNQRTGYMTPSSQRSERRVSRDAESLDFRTRPRGH